MVHKDLVNTFVLEWFYSYTSALAIRSEASFVTASMTLLFRQMFHILNRRSGFLGLRGKGSHLMVTWMKNIKWCCHISIRLSGTAGTKKASHSLRISVRNWRVVWDIYSFFTIQNTQHSWVLYYSAPSSAGNYLYLLEGFHFPLGRSQDSIKSRSKITFLFFMLDTDYLGKGRITRKSPI